MNLITYTFTLQDGRQHRFEVDLDRSMTQNGSEPTSDRAWTKLEYQQCSHCPLRQSDTVHCPAALDIEAVAEEFKNFTSVERVDVAVETAQRSFSKNCDMQEGLRSLFGLIMASGRCPILSKLKPLAYFHLPFATLQETVLRVIGIYLIKQRILHKEQGSDPDWALTGIETLYADLQIVNTHFMNRLRTASQSDANGNAIYSLWSLTSLVELGVDEMLEELSPILLDNG